MSGLAAFRTSTGEARPTPHHRQRLEVPSGITGLWQVSGRSSLTDFEEVVRLDLTYLQDSSLWLDFKILFKTIPAVRSSRGAS